MIIVVSDLDHLQIEYASLARLVSLAFFLNSLCLKERGILIFDCKVCNIGLLLFALIAAIYCIFVVVGVYVFELEKK